MEIKTLTDLWMDEHLYNNNLLKTDFTMHNTCLFLSMHNMQIPVLDHRARSV